jgi:hypothetical protein
MGGDRTRTAFTVLAVLVIATLVLATTRRPPAAPAASSLFPSTGPRAGDPRRAGTMVPEEACRVLPASQVERSTGSTVVLSRAYRSHGGSGCSYALEESSVVDVLLYAGGADPTVVHWSRGHSSRDHVAGLGQEAYWVAEDLTLYVAAGRHMFHITVAVAEFRAEEADRLIAISLASALIERLA